MPYPTRPELRSLPEFAGTASPRPDSALVSDRMRIGTWNLQRYPTAASEKAPDIVAFLEEVAVDLWLFTEVSADWPTAGGTLMVSPERRYGRSEDRWAGVWIRHPATAIRLSGEPRGELAAAEESLCLTRITLPSAAPGLTVLVACSVLPWAGAAHDWSGLPSPRLDDQAEYVLGHHFARIEAARHDDEPIIWGGDFNQELRRLPPERSQAGYRLAGTVGGISRLQSVFDRLKLRPLTSDVEQRIPGANTIDHLAVSVTMPTAAELEVHRPLRRDGRPVSDHAAYIALLPVRAPTPADTATGDPNRSTPLST